MEDHRFPRSDGASEEPNFDFDLAYVVAEVADAWANEPGVDDLKTGQQIDHIHYVLRTIIGKGGMGVVWEADDVKNGRKVALKFIAAPMPDFMERFERERRIIATLNHSYIATLYDSGTLEDGSPYLAMEYIEGQSIGN